MTCDLKHIFKELVVQFPTSLSDDCVILSTQNLPVPPMQIASDRLFIKKSIHEYQPSYRVDGLDFYAHKETYIHLGLLFLAAIFHPQPSAVMLELTHPATDIKFLIVGCERRDLRTLPGGYYTHPYAFVYFPMETAKHPFGDWVNPRTLPCFSLTNLKDNIVTEEDIRQRDTVRSFGSDAGSALFAELLLNAGQPYNTVNEYELEGESGFRGVGISSVEVRLFLPGSEFWDETEWRASD